MNPPIPFSRISLESAQRIIQTLDAARESLRSPEDPKLKVEKAGGFVDQAILDLSALIQHGTGGR